MPDTLGANLPTVSPTSAQDLTVLPSVNYNMPGSGVKFQEAASKISTDFNSVEAWTKLGAQTPTIKQMGADLTMEAAAARSAGQTLSTSQIDILKSLETSYTQPTMTAAQLNAATGATSGSSTHQVKLSDQDGNEIIFLVMPEITESRSVSYEAVPIVQGPGAFQKYKGTESVVWQVSATFIARTTEEATSRYDDLNTLRGWTMPFYGENTGKEFEGKLGAPPPVLRFFGMRGLIGEVPVVVTSVNWNWPKDVDYIPTSFTGTDGNFIPFPTVINVQFNLIESFSTGQINRFSLAEYRQGNMPESYSTPTGETGVSAASTPYAPPGNSGTTSPAFSGSPVSVDFAAKLRNKAIISVPPKQLPKTISESQESTEIPGFLPNTGLIM